jgi:hypothetical protein
MRSISERGKKAQLESLSQNEQQTREGVLASIEIPLCSVRIPAAASGSRIFFFRHTGVTIAQVEFVNNSNLNILWQPDLKPNSKATDS